MSGKGRPAIAMPPKAAIARPQSSGPFSARPASFCIAFRTIAITTVAAYVALAAALFLAVRATLGDQPYTGVAELFTTAAFVTFGGAYALLPYVAERAVGTYGWLTAEQMLNGLAIAEATPGPLILVNTCAGFFAGWNGPGDGWAGVFTAALATFYTFAPSFMLILAAAPHVEHLQNAPNARRALAGVSAAVVGVILNLAVYLAEASFLPAGLGDPDWT
jgi:chromate transporter